MAFGRSEEQPLHGFQRKTSLAGILKDGDVHEEATKHLVDGKSTLFSTLWKDLDRRPLSFVALK